MSVDGVRLRQSWNTALNDAQAQLQSLLTSAASPLWRRVPPVTSESTQDGSQSASEEAQVIIHKRPSKQGEIFRLVHDIPVEDFSIAFWKAVLVTPEMRQEWDPAVESAQLLETFDVDVRIAKTYFTLGWPANPRDAITISRTLSDGATLLDVTTSLPRSPDEPPYLRPTPPYVRSHVHLFAWVIQQVPTPTSAMVRVTCFWQHDLKAVLGMGMPSRAQHLCSMMLGIVKAVKKFGGKIPVLQGFGLGVGMEHMAFDVGRKALTVEYSVVHEQEGDNNLRMTPEGMDDARTKKERRRLERSMEFVLPNQSSWDVQMVTRTSSSQGAAAPWTVNVYRDTEDAPEQEQLLLRTRHAPPPSVHALVKVRLVIEAAAGTAGLLRLNGHPHAIEPSENRDLSALSIPDQLLQDASNVGALSFQTSIANGSFADDASRTTSTRVPGGRTEGSQKSISKLVKRNYVYFASLLQEPEVKWKPLVEARGVAVTQLDSIDPTLVVYKAEAVFVGVSVWDLISVISTPGATVYWDKNFDGANLIEDVSELSQLWHFKTKAAWPVNARESVLLRSTYKSPTSVHIFSFSTDDPQLFPGIPQSDPSVIRTQVDLRGWAIEALSPTTTQVTLIEQSDPKGWSNKSSLPQQIIAAVSGVGEFAIKCGGPPMLNRLGGGRALVNRYDHERAIYRLEYETDATRAAAGSLNNSTPFGSVSDLSDTLTNTTPPRSSTECELRCDIEVWGGPIDIVIDPPPQSVSCLRRHRLSDNGGGLWVTIEHDADFVLDERLRVVVRKGASTTAKDKGTVIVNGAKVKVEMEELPDAEVKLLSKRKRVKPIRIPLDQPPVVSAIQRKRVEWAADPEASPTVEEKPVLASLGHKATASTILGNPISRFMTMAVSQATYGTTSAMSAVAKPFALTEQTVPTSNKEPMQHALDALAYLRALYNRPSQDGWVQVTDNAGLVVLKKLETEVSRTIPVHKATKVIEGVTAEELMNVLMSYDCRKQWDDRFDSAVVLQDFGHGCQTTFTIVKGAFPFQPRGFYTATLAARSANPYTPSAETGKSGGLLTPQTDAGTNPVYYHATTSFNPESVAAFAPSKYNPFNYAVGRVLLRGWICETLDPYTAENYAIPSTRCTFVSAVDFAGAVPVAYNSVLNASLPRAILRLENYLKNNITLPFSYIPSIGIAVEPQEGPQEGWSFDRKDEGQLLVGRQYDTTERQLRARVLVDLPLGEKEPPKDEVTPTPSKILNAPRPRHESISLPGGLPPEIPRSWSPERDSIRQAAANRFNSMGPAPANFTRKALPSFSNTIPKDYIIAELVVDSKHYPDGFAVETFSQLRTPEEFVNLSPPLQELQHILPTTTTIFAIPANLFKSSHSEKSGSRYLVRVSLQTARYDAPTIADPLTGQTRSAPPKPSWLLELMEKGGLVDVLIKPPSGTSSSTPVPGQPYKVVVDGVTAEILSERRALAMLGKVDTEPVSRMPWVARSDNATFPKELSIPLAVAKDCLSDIKVDKQENVGDKAPGDTSDEVAAIATREGDATQAIPNPNGSRAGLGTFFTSYSWWGKRIPAPTTESEQPAKATSAARETSPTVEPPKEPGTQVTTTTARQSRGSIPIPAALILAFICFLLGSLVRSLLSPTDFIIVKNPAEITDLDEHGNWRRLTRLIELKYILRGNDLVIGIAHA